MSAISNDLHSFFSTIKTDLGTAIQSAETVFEGATEELLSGLETDISAAGPQVLSIITAAVLAVATGGTSAFAPALSAAVSAIGKEGLVVAEHVLAGIVSAVIANLPTPSVAVTSPAAPVAQAA